MGEESVRIKPGRRGVGYGSAVIRPGTDGRRGSIPPVPCGRQEAELAAGALPPLDPPEDDPPEDDPLEDDPPADDPEDEDDPDEEPDDEDEEDPDLSPDDDSDFAGLPAVPPAVVSEPDARESVR
ncbi:hypothetical protein [Micromonospora chokoriensis]|uniref:Uncharacterized protein n=1 Tax=Micromonospora chokoriensis TaxID=356851 RepID=A0A1C4UL77_9ACTN|nr:hypothetical protein [Micromonospora chokoriensis]SCE72424.1 hypothetical protein GA0070612_0531 [Micromonospora chokoriensis]